MIARAGRIGVVLIVSIIALCCWWVVASDYGDAVAVGTYRFSQGGMLCELVLKPDHTFVQEMNSAASVARAVGTWRRVGQGGVSFSSTLLPIPGEEVEPDGTSFADMHKTLGFLVTLQMRRYHVLWYGRSNPQSAASPVGKYYGDAEGVTAKLTLDADHSFEQEVTRSGVSARAKGTWSTGTDGAVIFSPAFLKVSGKPLSEDESATADDPQGSNLQITIANISSTGAPTFRTKWLFW